MAYRALILRVLKVSAVSVLGVILCVGAWVQFQQRLLRWRAEHLLADMQSIRLYQSDWSDAQRLMRRWGAWGHYEGLCTAADCEYEIQLVDASWQGSSGRGWEKWVFRDWVYQFAVIRIYGWLGGHMTLMRTQFIVQDGRYGEHPLQ